MKFLPVFVLRVTHAYYADGRCPDFLIEPNPETERLLSNHRCVLKPLPDGIRVLTAVDDGGKAFIALPPEATFTFHLRLHNPDFVLFTDLSDINKQAAPLYTNAGLKSGDSRDSVKLEPVSRTAWFIESFTVVQPASKDHFTLRGCPLAGLKPKDFEIESSVLETPEDYNPNGKVITVNSQSAPKGEKFTVKYPVESRLERGVFADAEIHWNNTVSSTSDIPVEFLIAFTAKQNLWTYYFVIDLERSKGSFQIDVKDQSSSDSASVVVFNDKNRRDLNQNPDPSDDIAQELARQYPDTQRFRFVSDDLIPCRQAARKHLELYLDDSLVCRALPNPSFRNYTKIEIKDDAHLHQQDALFQVVKYLTHPFSKRGV